MKTKKIRLQCLSGVVKSAQDGAVYIEGYANRKTVDRSDEIIESDAWTLDDYKKNPVILYNHGMDAKLGQTPVGKCEKIEPREDGLYVKAKVSSVNDPDINRVRELVKEGMLRAFSVGFSCKDSIMDEKGIRRIKKADLFEISIVGVPMNQDSLFSITGKMLENNSIEQIRAKICSKKGAKNAAEINKKMHKYIELGNINREELIDKMSLESGISGDVIKSMLIGDEEMADEVLNNLSDAVKKSCVCEKSEKGSDMEDYSEPEDEIEDEDEDKPEDEIEDKSEDDSEEVEDPNVTEEEHKAYEDFIIDFLGSVRPQLVQEDKDVEFEDAINASLNEKFTADELDQADKDIQEYGENSEAESDDSVEEEKHFTENNPDHHRPGYVPRKDPKKGRKRKKKKVGIFTIPGFDYSKKGKKSPEIARKNARAEKRFIECYRSALSWNRGSIFARLTETKADYRRASVASVKSCGGKYKSVNANKTKQADQEGVSAIAGEIASAKTGVENNDYGNPHLEAQKQTNVFLGQLIAEIQKMSAKLDQMQGGTTKPESPATPDAEPVSETKSVNPEEKGKAALDLFNKRLENCIIRLKALGVE